jgi:hypothetical protein
MATVYHHLLPEEAQYLATAFPQYVKNNGTNFPVSGLAYDAGDNSNEKAFWKLIAVNYGSGDLTLDIFWYADTASSGDVLWSASISAITPNTDTQDIETDGLATASTVTDSHLGTTNQRLHKATITVSNLDSLAANDHVTISIMRDTTAANADTMTGDTILVVAILSYSDS